MSLALTQMQMRFVEEYLVDPSSPAKAAIRAGYSPDSASSQACGLMNHEGIREAIEVAQNERAKRLGVDKLRILQELALIAFSNPKDVWTQDSVTGELSFDLNKLSRDVTASLAEISVTTTSGKTTTKAVKAKQIDRLAALQLLGKHLGMFSDKLQVEGKLSLEELVMASYPKKDNKEGDNPTAAVNESEQL